MCLGFQACLSGELDGDQRFGPPRGPKHWAIVVREEVARGKEVAIMLGWGTPHKSRKHCMKVDLGCWSLSLDVGRVAGLG